MYFETLYKRIMKMYYGLLIHDNFKDYFLISYVFIIGRMSSVNRVLKKRREAHSAQPEQHAEEPRTGGAPSFPSTPTPPAQFDPQRQKLYEQYSNYSQYNPASFEFSNSYMPNSLNLYNRYKAPLSCYINPINPSLQYVEQSGNSIPRCGSCRAYMNYYNEISKKSFRCFLCGRDNPYDFQYDINGEGVEKSQPSYLVDGANGVYPGVPPQNTYIFMIDVSKDAAQSKMLSYMVTVMKTVLARQDLNQTLIYFYTFDDSLHSYNFSGEQAERTVLDPTLKSEGARPAQNYLGQIREKLFDLLDSLQQLADKNTRTNSRFFDALNNVYEQIKHTGGKIFVFQANQAIAGQNHLNQNFKWSTNPQENIKVKSLLQTKNKLFFNRFVQPMLLQNISIAFFVFARGRKNIRALSDTCKLTNSELLYYNKDSDEELNRFYYEFYHLLNTVYYVDTRIEFIISAGWYYTAVYGNIYRLKQFITFKICHYEDSKRICAVFLPQDGFNPAPCFSLQIVTNYIYGRKHYLSVNTAVVPFTNSIDRLFQNMHIQITAATFFKIYLSALRLEDTSTCKQKYIKHVSSIWKCAYDYYKDNFTPQLRGMFLSYLAFLKNYHSQIDLICDTPILQKVVSNRNMLQSCNYPDCNVAFSPYLFDLTTIGEDRCLQQNFLYPDVCQLRFSSVKQGLFLMDTGNALYLYIARQYHPNYTLSLFGKEKITKQDKLDQQTIVSHNNKFSRQVQQLIRVLRESKTYQWVPLYVIRCGQNTEHEKNFYLNFYEQKYDEFKSYKQSYDEFISMLSKQY